MKLYDTSIDAESSVIYNKSFRRVSHNLAIWWNIVQRWQNHTFYVRRFIGYRFVSTENYNFVGHMVETSKDSLKNRVNGNQSVIYCEDGQTWSTFTSFQRCIFCNCSTTWCIERGSRVMCESLLVRFCCAINASLSWPWAVQGKCRRFWESSHPHRNWFLTLIGYGQWQLGIRIDPLRCIAGQLLNGWSHRPS